MKMIVSITQMQEKHHHTTGCPTYKKKSHDDQNFLI